MEENRLRDKAVQSTLWSFLDLWGSKVGSFVIFFALVRLLPPEAFGLLSLAWIFIIFIQNFGDLGFTDAVIQREELEPEHLDTAFWTSVVTSLLLLGAVIAALPFAARFVDDDLLLDIVLWLSACLPLRSLTRVQNALLRREFRFKTLTLRSVLATLAGGAVGIAMAVAGYGVWSLVGQQLVFYVVSTLVLWSAASWTPTWSFSRRHFGELFTFGRSVIGARTMDFVNRRSDSVLIGVFLGPVALGYYTVASKIVLVLTESLMKVITSVSLPVFSRMQRNVEQLRRTYYGAVKLLGLLIVPAFVGVAVSAPVVVPTVFGEVWTASIPVMQALALLGIAQCMFNLESGLLLAAGKPQWRFQLNVFTTAASLVAFFLSYQWGIVAVALAFAVRGYLMLPAAVFLTKRLLGFSLGGYLRQYVTPAVGAAAVLLVAWLMPLLMATEDRGLVLLVQVIACAAAYAAVTAAIDWTYIRSLVRMGRSAIITQVR